MLATEKGSNVDINELGLIGEHRGDLPIIHLKGEDHKPVINRTLNCSKGEADADDDAVIDCDKDETAKDNGGDGDGDGDGDGYGDVGQDDDDDDDDDNFHSLPSSPNHSRASSPARSSLTSLRNSSMRGKSVPNAAAMDSNQDEDIGESDLRLNVDLDETEMYPLHKCVFMDDYRTLAHLLKSRRRGLELLEQALSQKDRHGNTPLHLAVMLGRKEAVRLLLHYNAPVKTKNGDGWTVLAEAISYGDRDTIMEVLKKLRQQSQCHLEDRREHMIRGLEQMRDFYMEFKWDFASWLPLVSRILPSDVCRIHKCGSSLRLDTTLVDFNDMRWERGDISFIFRGDYPMNQSLSVLDNEYECYQRIHYEETDIEDEVDMLMSTDILSANISTKNVRFSRAQSGWIFRADRKEVVSGQYNCELYSINGLVLRQRKRREHLSQEDLQKNKAIMDSITRGRRSSITNGNSSSCSTDGNSVSSSNAGSVIEVQRRSSLQPPPAPKLTWEEYIKADSNKCPPLGRVPIHKQTNRSLRATVAMSKDFPLNVDMLLNILEVIAPLKHINKLREFVAMKLPAGFPVRVEIPVLHTVTAKITFQKFEFCDNIPSALFVIPAHYVEDARRFPDL